MERVHLNCDDEIWRKQHEKIISKARWFLELVGDGLLLMLQMKKEQIARLSGESGNTVGKSCS